jgi:hypothetical protein
LAATLGLHPNVLGHKLHGSDSAMLRHEDIKGIVRMLAEQQQNARGGDETQPAVTRRSQAIR